MSAPAEQFVEDLPDLDEDLPYCVTCQNTGEIDCHCGGDLCVCGAYELPCPDCNRGLW